MNDSFLRFVGEEPINISKPCCTSRKSDMQLVLRIQKRLVLMMLSAASAVV